MDGCAVPLFLLLLVGGVVALVQVRKRLDAAERRLNELGIELIELRRQTGGGSEGPREARRESPEDAVPETAVPEIGAAAASAVVETVEEMPEMPAVAPEPAAVEAAQPPITQRQTVAQAESTVAPKAAADAAPESPRKPPAKPPTKPPPAAPKAPKIRIDWEHWIGVRGAAVLGGAVLALAAILFLKFSIERGLIPPIVRVTLGILAGLGAIGGAEFLRKKAYGTTANALSGAGIVILYASIWAAQRLYDLIPVLVAFTLMVLVTAACGLLSWRHRSLVIAMLGLLGGFATPFMLATGKVNPIGLFGYILLLDVGLLVLSRKMGWPLLASLGLFGTLIYQAFWIFGQLESDRLFLTLLILAVFAALFAAAGGVKGPADGDRRQRRFTTIAGVSLPFAFAVYMAARADLGEHILPIAILLLLLSAAACWMGRVHAIPLLAPGAAAAGVAVVAVWAVRTTFAGVLVWEIVGVATVLTLLFRFLGSGKWTAEREPNQLAQSAVLVAGAGFLLVLLGSSLAATATHLWPWVVGWIALSLLLVLEARKAVDGGPSGLVAPLVAAAEVVTVGLWVLLRTITVPLAWEVVGVAVVLSLFFDVVTRQRGGDGVKDAVIDAARSSPLVAASGFFMVLALAPVVSPASSFWPWLTGWVVLAALLVSRGAAEGRGSRQVVASLLLGFSFVFYLLARNEFDSPPQASVFFGLVILFALGFQVLAILRRQGPVRRQAEMAAAAFPSLLLFGLLLDAGNPYLPSGFFLGVGLLLAGLVALSATRYPSGPLYLGAVTVLALVHSMWTAGAGEELVDPGLAVLALLIQAGAVVLFTFWPFVAGKRLAASRWALYGSALAGPLWFLSLKRLFEARFGSGAIGLLPLLLGVAGLLAALAARRLWAEASPERRRSLVWFLAVTFAFVSVAIPLQLEKEWITVGWALEGLALMALWKRLDHPGLKYLGLALLAAVTLRLVLNPAIFGYYPRSGRPIFNWLMYTYLIPVAALLLSARLLSALEVDRLLAWESAVYALFKRHALGAIACGLAAILVGFWWINLTVIDFFSVGQSLDLSFERLPARDVSLSISWAIYALILLAVGMARRSVGLRWLSLGFLILTIGKVFLYDLGQLKDLYRVASLVGLAVSLLLVSLAYQRFVFGRDGEGEKEKGDEP